MIASLPETQRNKIYEGLRDNKPLAPIIAKFSQEQREYFYNNLTEEQAFNLLFNWRLTWARPKQKPPSWDWNIWLLLAGRGFGKTRTGAEWVREKVEEDGVKRIALVGETPGDVRDVMLNGPGGLLNIYPPGEAPHYYPSKRKVVWDNGAVAGIFSGANPDQLRGPEHEIAWADELAAWDYPKDTWDNLMMGLRLGDHPRVVATTTPRPIPVIKSLVERAEDRTNKIHITRGSTYENKENLPKIFLQEIIAEYEGTRKGRQELYAEILSDVEGALWNYTQLDNLKIKEENVPSLKRIVVGVDPATTNNEDSDETGIIVVGLGSNNKGYVFDDYSLIASPTNWAKASIKAYEEYEAHRVVGETNNGGDMVETIIRTVDPTVSYKSVRASQGKYTRAEPVSSLYEQEKIFHVGTFKKLEDQMCNWSPKSGEDSPDRLDALVWAITELFELDKKSKNRKRTWGS